MGGGGELGWWWERLPSPWNWCLGLASPPGRRVLAPRGLGRNANEFMSLAAPATACAAMFEHVYYGSAVT